LEIQLRNVGGDEVVVPLLDSYFGAGKTTFAQNYFAMVERFLCGLGSDSLDDVWSRLVPGESKYGNSLRTVLTDLKAARSLFVDFSGTRLWDSAQRKTYLVHAVRESLSRLGIGVPQTVSWRNLIQDYLPKPTFLIFDEIGAGFSNCLDDPDRRISGLFLSSRRTVQN
jgi:hypothetical protein